MADNDAIPMTDEADARALANLTPEQEQELIAQAQLEAEMNTPLKLRTQWRFDNVTFTDETQGVCMRIRTPVYTATILLSRDDAQAFASQLRKAANGGPSADIVTPPKGLYVPGR